MKTILATLLASTVAASAITITINSDTPTGLDFTLDWSQGRLDSWAKSFGSGGSSVEWLGPIGRNQNYSFIEIDALCDPSIHGFGIQFWPDPDYSGAVPKALGSPNLHWMGPNTPLTISPLDYTQFGARFTYGASDDDYGAFLFSLGLAGIVLVKWLEARP